MVKALNCWIVVREFDLVLLRSLSNKYPWGRYKRPYPPYGLNKSFYKDGFGIK